MAAAEAMFTRIVWAADPLGVRRVFFLAVAWTVGAGWPGVRIPRVLVDNQDSGCLFQFL